MSVSFAPVFGLSGYPVKKLNSVFYKSLSTKRWMQLSGLFNFIAYAVMLSSRLFSNDYFLYFTWLFGFFYGLSSGVGYGLICIAPFSWLDKKRAVYGPYLTWIGALGSLIGSPLAALFAEFYTWR